MNSRTVRSYLYEGIVIVASILVAFALDASWASYQESKVEQRVLVELRDEFQSAKARVEVSVAELETVIEASLDLVGALGKDPIALSPEVAQDIVNRALTFNTLEVPTSVVDSIVASGQVRLISNRELREALAEWPAFVSDVRENHEWHRVETDEFLVPYLSKFLSIRDAFISSGALTIESGSFEYDLMSMQRDPVFEGRLVWRISRQQATLAESKILLGEIEELLALTRAEIG